MPSTRSNTQKNYKFINEFGLDYAEDVLDISDPTSDIFDDEIKGETINKLKEQIEDLEISISDREFELQGAISKSLPRVSSSGPLTTSKKRYKSVPISRNESNGPELVKHQQRVSTAGKFDQKNIGADAKKDEKPNRRTGKDKDLVQKKKKKGEINLDKLRNKKNVE